MTIRGYLKRRRVVSWSLLFGSLALAVLGGAPQSPLAHPAVLTIGLAGFLVAIVYSNVANRCPLCRGPLGSLMFNYGISRRVRFCPFCGVSMDEEL